MKIQLNKTTNRYELLEGSTLVKSYLTRKDLQNYIDINGIVVEEEVEYQAVSYDIPKFSVNKDLNLLVN